MDKEFKQEALQKLAEIELNHATKTKNEHEKYYSETEYLHNFNYVLNSQCGSVLLETVRELLNFTVVYKLKVSNEIVEGLKNYILTHELFCWTVLQPTLVKMNVYKQECENLINESVITDIINTMRLELSFFI